MKKQLTLGTPITIGDLEVSALPYTAPFRTGFLRGGPKTPQWFIDTVKAVMAKLTEQEAAAKAAGKDAPELDDEKLLEGLDIWPKGEDIDQLVPWLMHIAEKATKQPADVVDQLDLADLLKLIWQLLPGMMSLANFRKTSGSGAGTSPGSGTGALAT
jgi:hypothetical protein